MSNHHLELWITEGRTNSVKERKNVRKGKEKKKEDCVRVKGNSYNTRHSTGDFTKLFSPSKNSLAHSVRQKICHSISPTIEALQI